MKHILNIFIVIEYIIFLFVFIFIGQLNYTNNIHPYGFILGYLLVAFFLILVINSSFLIVWKIKHKHKLDNKRKYLIFTPLFIFLIYTSISMIID
jgi:hypothetical protein